MGPLHLCLNVDKLFVEIVFIDFVIKSTVGCVFSTPKTPGKTETGLEMCPLLEYLGLIRI